MGAYREFLRINGMYLLLCDVLERIAGRARSAMIARKLKVKKLSLGPRCQLRGLACIEMGEDFQCNEGLWLEAVSRYYGQRFTPRIKIGDRVRISHHVHIAATTLVEIGDDVLLGSKVVILDHNHGLYGGALPEQNTSPEIAPSLRPLDSGKKVFIGRNAWLCDAVVVTAGSTIGEGSVIGANSVVKGEIPPYCIAVGSPAVVVKRYNPQTERWEGVR
ncbi:MAG: acyltransferase [Acidobacteriota bacterium]|nr:acyltransferase [Acidobacteriota bacterium]